jgi:hypothetical protein
MVLASAAGWAAAGIKNAHVLDMRLPDGSLAHIRYIGDTPPTVSFAPAPMALSSLSSDPDLAPLTALERTTETLDRQVDAIFRQFNGWSAMALGDPDLTQVGLGSPNGDVQGFSMVSTMSGNGVCTRSVRYRSLGAGKPPQVVTRISGDCAAGQDKPASPRTSGSTAEPSKIGQSSA